MLHKMTLTAFLKAVKEQFWQTQWTAGYGFVLYDAVMIV